MSSLSRARTHSFGISFRSWLRFTTWSLFPLDLAMEEGDASRAPTVNSHGGIFLRVCRLCNELSADANQRTAQAAKAHADRRTSSHLTLVETAIPGLLLELCLRVARRKVRLQELVRWCVCQSSGAKMCRMHRIQKKKKKRCAPNPLPHDFKILCPVHPRDLPCPASRRHKAQATGVAFLERMMWSRIRTAISSLLVVSETSRFVGGTLSSRYNVLQVMRSCRVFMFARDSCHVSCGNERKWV